LAAHRRTANFAKVVDQRGKVLMNMPPDACSIRLAIALAALGTIAAYALALVTAMLVP
jgi:hypothetical protein